MKGTLVILVDVENKQESYYSYIDLYMACMENDMAAIASYSETKDLYCYLETNRQSAKERANTIEKLYLSDNLCCLSQMDFSKQNVGSICLYFRLSMDDASDVTNLIYYFLIKQYMEAEADACPVYCQLLIDDGSNNIIRFKITQFLVFESKKENPVFLKSSNVQYGYAVNLPGKAENSTYTFRSLEKFYPLLEIREDTYKMLSGTIYGTLVTGGGEVTRFPERSSRNYLSEAMTSKDILIDMCMYYLTGEGTKDVREQTKAFFYSAEFFDAVKNMNLLSFLIMCSFEFYLSQGVAAKEEMRELSLSSFHKKIDLSNNLASGLLQIIENIIAHTKYHKGYFSFRILSEDSAYLHNNYESYLNSLSQKKLKCDMHLEVKVCDLNLNKKGDYSSAITQCFLENLDRRGKDDENRRQMWRDRFCGISVKDFFITGGVEEQETDIWEDYYAAKENWLHHYGLRLYARIVDKACGLFEVNSQIGLDKEPEKQHYSTLGTSVAVDYLPGTQYNIILPYVAKTINQEPIGIDSSINFDKSLQKLLNEKQDVHVESICGLIEKIDTESEEKFYNFQFQKEYFVEKMEDALREKYANTLKKKGVSPAQLVLILDAQGVTSSLMQEVAAKAVWSYMCSRECDICYTDCTEYILLAITNCSFELINYLSATISIYFGLNSNRRICGKTQLYICDSNGEDFLISGSTLAEIRARAYKFAASRGIFPGVLTYLFSDLGKQNSSGENRERMLVEPFDILIQHDGEARFIELVKRVMDREIYYPDYGCKLSSIHIKLGSKIHIRNFYEAEILFQDSYFSKRMAYFVVKDILGKLSEQTENFIKKRLVLVGYENYSEMFLYDIHKFLKDALNYRKADVFLDNYVVCMDINGALELNRDDFRSADDMEFIVIVSLNSSLTTFCKIKAVLEKKAKGKLKIFANYAVMLFRDDYDDSTRVYNKEDLPEKRMTKLEHKYWHSINSETKMVKSRFIEQEIRYFISSIAGWEEPLRCRMCFPEKVIEEKALIYTNKISIVPFMQYGLVKKHGNAIWIDAVSSSKAKKSAVLDKWNEADRDNEVKSEVLAKNVRYGHIRRNDNHFLYYFDTKTLFDDSRQKLIGWLKGIDKEMRSSAEAGNHAFAVYNILVTSIHESNTGFVEMINDCVFGNAAYVVRFDINRTYRDNLVARYSNLTLLYQRLLDIANETNDYAQINFYYADDTIVSGRTYERARSLIGSLYGKINSELQKKCQVNIFTGCFLLLNRLSEESERGILGEGCVCYKYYDVPISSIRNHEDFCFMCNLIKSASQLRKIFNKRNCTEVEEG